VIAANKVYDGTTSAILGGTATVVALGSDQLAVSGTGVGVFADANVGVGKMISVSGYTLSGADAGNYDMQQPIGVTANITASSDSSSLLESFQRASKQLSTPREDIVFIQPIEMVMVMNGGIKMPEDEMTSLNGAGLSGRKPKS
jgi:hypothetical protein